MSYVAENLAYLLWKESDLTHAHWLDTLATWASCNRERAEEILLGAALEQAEQTHIAATVLLTEEELQYIRLIEQDGVNILHENLRYLFETVQHGNKKVVAERIGINPVTLSKWLSGKTKPNAQNLLAIKEAFGISSKLDLAQAPLFLSIWPTTAQQQKQWAQERIEAMSANELNALFPALRKLLRDE